MSPKLQAFSQQHAPQVLTELREYFAQQKKDAGKLSPHMLHSIEVLDEFVFRGGKNIRSLLVVLGYHLAGGNSPAIYRVAAGVELFHKHILNLDDMADRDERRYGGSTLWLAYQAEFEKLGWTTPEHHARTMSEIDGTLLGSFAFEMVRTAEFPADDILKVIGVMNQIMYWQTVTGWQLHYYQNQQPLAEANEAEFVRGLELVTAKYTFVAPLLIGVMLAKKDEDVQLKNALEKYGIAVGRAFQMQDDILGLFGEPEELGKPVGNDVREGKKTILMQRAFHAASPADQVFLTKVCGSNLDQSALEKVRTIVQETGALRAAQELASQSVTEGSAALSTLPASPEKEILLELAQFVVERAK